MNYLAIGAWMAMGLALAGVSEAVDTTTNAIAESAGATVPQNHPAKSLYHVRAGGESVVGFTNLPASNRVFIGFKDRTDRGPVFRLTNREPHTILLYNVRVQTRSEGKGTDGLGWDTIYSDYPDIVDRNNSAKYATNAVGEFRVRQPNKAPWRVCIIYSTDWTDSGNTYSGDYEVISEEMKE